MDFNPLSLLPAFIFGVIGMYLFSQGKKNVNYTHVFVGILMMIYPYFVDGPLQSWGVGLALAGVAYFFR